MKVGFIVECVNEGPETKVLPQLAALVDVYIECEVEPLGSKPKVLQECGKYAKALLNQEQCDRVVVVWDARPPWKEEDVVFDPAEEMEKARQSLAQNGLAADDRVHLICIVEELEAWLLTDGRGVTTRINQLRGGRGALKTRVSDYKKVEQINWPKATMEKLFKQGEVRAYNDWLDAGAIAAAIPDDRKLRRHSRIFPELCAALQKVASPHNDRL
jgi:hypothetical protein